MSRKPREITPADYGYAEDFVVDYIKPTRLVCPLTRRKSEQNCILLREAYAAYCIWCDDNDHTIINKPDFHLICQRHYKSLVRTVVDGRRVRNVLIGCRWKKDGRKAYKETSYKMDQIHV